MRLTRILIFEQPYLMSIIFTLAKPFLSRKLSARISLCGKEIQQLDKVIKNVSELPTELGGEIADMKCFGEWIDQQMSSTSSCKSEM